MFFFFKTIEKNKYSKQFIKQFASLTRLWQLYFTIQGDLLSFIKHQINFKPCWRDKSFITKKKTIHFDVILNKQSKFNL